MHIRTEFPHQIVEIENEWIPLAGGTRLAARIWRPLDAASTPVPAVLEYLPYRKDDCTAADDAMRHPYFAGHGYASVRVDLRGTGDSDGLLLGEYLEQEHDDAVEVLAWLEAQPWCTGAVGMIGYSWGGFNGLQIAARRPPQLKAVITHASTDDRYRDDCHYMGGCMLASDMLKWATSMLTYPLQPPDPRFVGDEWREMWLHRLRNAPELAADWISHQRYDEFWKHGSVAEDYSAIECPVFAVGGWADAYTNAVPRLLEHLSVPRLGLIGPWGHMFPYEGVPGPAIGFLQEAVRWWDRWLKGIDNGIMDEPVLRAWIQEYAPPATFYAVRPGRWVAEESWPPPSVTPRGFVLRSDGSLADADGSGADGPLDSGVPDVGPRWLSIVGRQECGETAGVWCANGNPDEIAGDQGPDDERSLTFTTEPLGVPLELLGNPVAHLRVRADRPLALVAVRVEDVAPDGSSLLVSWGMLNLTHRDGHESPEPLEPGVEYDVRIESRVCGHRFAPGHRLRLALSPTYWPHAWPSPEPVNLEVATNGRSVLELPAHDASGPAAEVSFPEPEIAGPLLPRTDGRNDRSRDVRVHAGGKHEIVDTEIHEQTVAATGSRYRQSGRDSYSITEGDPLSARAACEREVASESDAAHWSVRVSSEMTGDATHFHVTEHFEAAEDGAVLLESTRSYAIPRDLV
jgi:uncharacterized protein